MRRLGILTTVLAIAMLAACGNDTSSGSSSGAGFAAKASAACRTATAALQSVRTSGDAPQVRYLALDDDVQTLLGAIDALPASDSQQGAVYRLLDGYRAVSKAAVAASQSINGGTDAAAAASTYASATSAPVASINTASQKLGIPDCANPPISLV